MELSRLKFIDSEEFLWGVVNRNGDKIAQQASSYKSDEVALYRKILKSISASARLEQSHLDLTILIQRESSAYCSAAKAEELLDSFINDFWLQKS